MEVSEGGIRSSEQFPVIEGPHQQLFFVLSDATSSKATYPVRFLPPKENRLALAVTAGEKANRGEND